MALVIPALFACSSPEPADPTETPAPVISEPTRAPSATPAAPANEVTPTSTSPVTIPTTALEGVSIDFWHVWEADQGAFIDGLVDAFNAENPFGFKVVSVRKSDLVAEMRQALDAGSPPDVAVGFNYNALHWDRAGEAVVDLSGYIADPEVGYSQEALSDFVEPFLLADRIGDKQLVLPFYRSADLLFYNRSFAREIGFDTPPRSLSDLEAQACAAAKTFREDGDVSNDARGGLMLSGEAGAMLSWIYAYGGSLVSTAGSRTYSFNAEETGLGFAFAKGLLDAGCAWLPADRYPNPDFAARQGLFMQAGLSGVNPQLEAFQAAGNPDEWGLLPYPFQESGQFSLVEGPGLVLFSSSQEEQLAGWLFMKWFLDTERLADWAGRTGYIPARQSSIDQFFSSLPADSPFQDIRDLLEAGVPLPAVPSWPAVQWVLSDTAQVLYAPLTTQADLQAIISELDLLAEEVDGFYR